MKISVSDMLLGSAEAEDALLPKDHCRRARRGLKCLGSCSCDLNGNASAEAISAATTAISLAECMTK